MGVLELSFRVILCQKQTMCSYQGYIMMRCYEDEYGRIGERSPVSANREIFNLLRNNGCDFFRGMV